MKKSLLYDILCFSGSAGTDDREVPMPVSWDSAIPATARKREEWVSVPGIPRNCHTVDKHEPISPIEYPFQTIRYTDLAHVFLLFMAFPNPQILMKPPRPFPDIIQRTLTNMSKHGN